jgi:cytoskeletal protein CcmA (bactofilin family)
MKKKKVVLACPKCGHEQEESAAAYSTTCKACRHHIRLADVLKPAANKKAPPPKKRTVTCFECGTSLQVPASAQSTMCKLCSSHVDLSDHQIAHSVSKNFRTKGTLILEESGYLFNTETTATHVVLKGRFIGKLRAEETLEIHPRAQIKGSIAAGRLIIPSATAFAWPEPIEVGGADISGELVGALRGTETVTLRATARVFGDIEARHLVVEEGAVFVGSARIGAKSRSGRK